MAQIHIVEPHQLPVDQAKDRLGVFGEILGKYGVRLVWEGTRAKLAGVPGVGGNVDVQPAEIDVRVKISPLITAMGLDPKRLEATIRRKLSEALRAP